MCADPIPAPADSILAPTAVSALYRNPRIGDLILRTSDGVELHVYRAIVAASASVFEDMFSIPQPPSTPDGKPTIDVAESSTVWETLIMLSYAPRQGIADDFADLGAAHAILEAGKKYNMPAATVCASTALVLPHFVEEQPYSVYALGCAYKLPEVARVAARHILRFPIYSDHSKELDLIPLRAYHRLSDYRRRYVVKPFLRYLETLYAQLEYLPDSNLARSMALKLTAPTATCIECARTFQQEVSRGSETVYRWIEEAISQVALEVEE
ncbi:hypothetical protein PYCCODRAFT_1414007 [Trametes coccinea BRFM310]|uniref:BTB domain-containing protein n=1 Tax=Trametes coccinea (strain BRFM310) TaxID=1353009 RepID=A0A1Y2IHG8_TRAC3|nr:hypothetical protein PYCCODRAFT_1414007 [Trametes coccinea BRFM310]